MLTREEFDSGSDETKYETYKTMYKLAMWSSDTISRINAKNEDLAKQADNMHKQNVFYTERIRDLIAERESNDCIDDYQLDD